MANIIVQNTKVSVLGINGDDFISLTDMATAKSGETRSADVIKNWLRNRYTIEFLVHGRLSITRILKWSNLTTLEFRQDYLLLC